MKVFSVMNRTKNGRLLIVQKDKLAGIITLKDLLILFALKMDLEGEDFSREEK
jgi:predicted transcriptional regulator